MVNAERALLLCLGEEITLQWVISHPMGSEQHQKQQGLIPFFPAKGNDGFEEIAHLLRT